MMSTRNEVEETWLWLLFRYEAAVHENSIVLEFNVRFSLCTYCSFV